MIGPRHGRGVCRRCFNLTDGYDDCYACRHTPGVVSAVVPISYSVAGEQLYHALAGYKRYSGNAGHRLGLGIAAVLCRFLSLHETCVARAAGVESLPVVTTVPSSVRALEQRHRLRELVSELVVPARDRYEPVLRRSGRDVGPREFC